MKAIWKDIVVAESSNTIQIEGNHYFPPESVNKELLSDSNTITSCFWKGIASYYNVVVSGDTLEDGAWYYREPTDAAKQIKDYVAFWKGVEVVE